MTRQAFLARIPSRFAFLLSLDPPLAFSLFLHSLPLPPSFFFSPPLPSFRLSAASVSSLPMILSLTFSFLLFFLLRFSPASEVSRDRVGWSLYSYRLLVPYSRETCARSTMFGTFTTDKPKANLYALIP